MDLGAQIGVAVALAVTGILLGLMMVGLAMLYRRRKLNPNYHRNHGVRFHKHHHDGHHDDVVRISLEQSSRHSAPRASDVSVTRYIDNQSRSSYSGNYDYQRDSFHSFGINRVVSRSSNSLELYNPERVQLDPHTQNATWHRDIPHSELPVDYSRSELDLELSDSSLEMKPVPNPDYPTENIPEYERITPGIGNEINHIPRPMVTVQRNDLFEEENHMYEFIPHENPDIRHSVHSRNSGVHFY